MISIYFTKLNRFICISFLLQKHKMSTNTLIWYGNYLQKLGETDSLLRIFEALPNTNSLYQIMLCDLLINIYSKLCFFIIFLAIQSINYFDVNVFVDIFVHR